MGSPHRAVLNQTNDNESDELDFDMDDMDEEIILTKEAADYEVESKMLLHILHADMIIDTLRFIH
jgi:hypothetical protein